MNPNLLTPLPVALLRSLTLATLALLAGCAQPPAAVPPASTPSSAAVPPAATASAFLPPEPPSGYTPKTIAFAPRDMVAAAHPLAVQAGVDVLAHSRAVAQALTVMAWVSW